VSDLDPWQPRPASGRDSDRVQATFLLTFLSSLPRAVLSHCLFSPRFHLPSRSKSSPLSILLQQTRAALLSILYYSIPSDTTPSKTMGNLVWHEYSRLVSLTASIYAVWASFFGLIYRKFFWDFVGGTLRNPGGLQPANNVALFIDIIVKVPVIQGITMLLGFTMIAIEFPLPQLKSLALHRSLVLRLVLLIFQAFFAVLFYQGTNAALWSLIAAGCYTRAIMLGEKMSEARANIGKGGRA